MIPVICCQSCTIICYDLCVVDYFQTFLQNTSNVKELLLDIRPDDITPICTLVKGDKIPVL